MKWFLDGCTEALSDPAAHCHSEDLVDKTAMKAGRKAVMVAFPSKGDD